MVDSQTRILVVDDDEDVLLAARLLLKQHGYLVQTEKDPQQIPERLKEHGYNVVLLDMNFSQDMTSGREGFYWLKEIGDLDPAAVVVLTTAYGDVELAVRTIKEGATDFVLKPWQNEKLLATLSAAEKLSRSRQETHHLRSRQQRLSADLDQPFHVFIGQSAAMEEVFATIEKVAGTDANVLLLGENSTGKELVARTIHRRSRCAEEVFINVDVGVLTESLFESELFGHVKGAFTDAKADRTGRFEIASGGTLFLDEIGNVPLMLQAKLLGAVENRQITKVGSNKPMSVDVRLICATNRPIYEMIASQEFRQDLLYRINTVEIRLPPLRDRTEDIPLLLQHYLAIYRKKYDKTQKTISARAVDKLGTYVWPGNVRELQHAVERAVIMSDDDLLGTEDFLLEAPGGAAGSGIVFENYNLENAEKEIVARAIQKHNGNVSRAAQELGLTRTSLYRRMRKYGI